MIVKCFIDPEGWEASPPSQNVRRLYIKPYPFPRASPQTFFPSRNLDRYTVAFILLFYFANINLCRIFMIIPVVLIKLP